MPSKVSSLLTQENLLKAGLEIFSSTPVRTETTCWLLELQKWKITGKREITSLTKNQRQPQLGWREKRQLCKWAGNINRISRRLNLKKLNLSFKVGFKSQKNRI
jgi:hypothetical protein